MIKVAVAGCNGRMGNAVCQAVNEADDLELVCGIDPKGEPSDQVDIIFEEVAQAIDSTRFDVLVDFTIPSSVRQNIGCALDNGIDCVVGTTGITERDLYEIYDASPGNASLFFAPNFTTGAVLLMQFSKEAAKYFPQVEIMEFHHCNKLDSPSGTALKTAHAISEARDGRPSEAPGKETESEGAEGARGALIDGIPVHSIRSMGYVASQEVVFGSYGQTLTLRHDSWDRTSYMPGVLLGIRESKNLSGVVIGLENIM